MLWGGACGREGFEVVPRSLEAETGPVSCRRRGRSTLTPRLAWIESRSLDHRGAERRVIPIDEGPGELPIESLRRLARGLVLERGTADDVVQEAWLAALQAHGEIRGLGAWLAGAVRRLARNRARVDGRRDRRERMAARAEAQPSAVE